MRFNGIILTLLVLFSFSCKKEKISDDSYFGSKVMIIGHRGFSAYYLKSPGNTLETALISIGIGADGCEFDVQLTKDSVLVFFHDFELDGKTNGNGKIYEHTWEELSKIKYLLFPNIYIQCADSVIEKIPNPQLYYFSFDCKLDKDHENLAEYESRFARAIQRLCNRFSLTKNIMIEGTESFLLTAKSLGLENKMFWMNNITTESIAKAKMYGFYGFSSQWDSDDRYFELAHQNNLKIMLYSPRNFTENKLSLKKRPDIIQSDDPISILKYLDRYNYEYIIP